MVVKLGFLDYFGNMLTLVGRKIDLDARTLDLSDNLTPGTYFRATDTLRQTRDFLLWDKATDQSGMFRPTVDNFNFCAAQSRDNDGSGIG